MSTRAARNAAREGLGLDLAAHYAALQGQSLSDPETSAADAIVDLLHYLVSLDSVDSPDPVGDIARDHCDRAIGHLVAERTGSAADEEDE